MADYQEAESQTRRVIAAGWALLVVRLLARGYLVFLLALAACAIAPMAFGLTGTVVQSGSMMPHIAVGDVVLSRALAADAKTPMGHVVTFEAPQGSELSGIRLHRIVGTNPDGTLITAGDSNHDADSAPLRRSDIIAVGCLLVPWIGLPAFWLQHGQVLPLAGWLAVTLLALLVEFLASQAETKERREHRPHRAGSRRRGVPALVQSIGIESALSITALILCGVMVAIAPFTPTVNAAFSARVVNAGNSWVAAISVTPAKLVFATNPSNSTGGVAFTTQPVVAIQTSTGGVTTSSAPVTLQITTPAGATLTCASNPRTAVAGVATFSGCAIDKAGTYTLTATSPGLTSAVSSAATITVGPAKSLVFTTTPLNTARNTAFTNQPVVAVKDAGGNTITSSTASVTLTLNGTGGGALTNCGSNPKSAVAGVVTFTSCRVSQIGSYTLTASSGTLTAATSASFSIFNTASKLVFLTSPSSSLSGAAFATQPVVAIEDSGGNITSGTGSVTLAITTPNGATLSCTANTLAAVNGTATFAGCAIGKSGTYTLRATSSSLTAATSASFTISAGPAARVAVTTSPSNTASATAFATQPVATVLDTFGNTITTSTAAVALTLTTPNGAILTCTANPKNAVAGVATFAGCRVDKVGTYTLTATSSGLTSALSSNFTISTGSATKLVFTTSPGAAVHNVTFPIQPLVEIQDAGGNLVTGATLVLLSITSPANGANLSCSVNPVLNLDGEVNFGGCRIDRAGTYTLTASASGLTSGISLSFVVS